MTTDIADIIAGELKVSRSTAYDLMREALKEASPLQEPVATVQSLHVDGKDIGVQAHLHQHLPVGTKLYTTPPAAQPAPVPHPDDLAVDRFATAMKAKMAKQRAKGYGGWDSPDQCPAERLQTMLIDHLAKGDTVDVGNFAMMLWNRGESTASPAPPAPVQEPVAQPASEEEMKVYRAIADNYRKDITTPTAAPETDAATVAGLHASISILSHLVDQQRQLLVEVEDVCGRDGHGAPFEDGESELIDKVRAQIAAINPPGENDLFQDSHPLRQCTQPALMQDPDKQLGIYEHRCPQVTGHRGPSVDCQKAGHGVSQDSYCKNCTCPPAAQPAPVQEPVAWKDKIYGNLHHQNFGDSIPLYDHPSTIEQAIEKFPQIAYWHSEFIKANTTPPAEPAPVQDVDWKDMYEKEKRRSEMWVAQYEKDIGPLEKAVPVAAQRQWVEPTDDEIDTIYCGAGKNDLLRAREVIEAFKEKNT